MHKGKNLREHVTKTSKEGKETKFNNLEKFGLIGGAISPDQSMHQFVLSKNVDTQYKLRMNRLDYNHSLVIFAFKFKKDHELARQRLITKRTRKSCLSSGIQ